jgi:chromosome segregation ATPase
MNAMDGRAADLTEESSRALGAARQAMSDAADVARRIDGLLRQCEDDLGGLAAEAPKLRDVEAHETETAAEEARPHLRTAALYADQVDERLRRGQGDLEELGDHLARARQALTAGQRATYELDQLQLPHGVATDEVRARLHNLRGAVQDAGENLDVTGRRIAAARRALEPVIYSSMNAHPRAAANQIRGAGEAVDGDMVAARRELAESRDGLDGAAAGALGAAQYTGEQAAAMRAAMNPTPASAMRAPAASSETDLRHRIDGPATDQNRDR